MCLFVMSSFKVVAVTSTKSNRILGVFKSIRRSSRRNSVEINSVSSFKLFYSVPEGLDLDRVTFKLSRVMDPIQLSEFSDWDTYQGHLDSLELMLTINHSLGEKFNRQPHQYKRYELSLDEVIQLSSSFKRSFNKTSYLRMIDDIIENGLFSIFVNKGFSSTLPSRTQSIIRHVLCCLKQSTVINQSHLMVSESVVRHKFELSKLQVKVNDYILEHHSSNDWFIDAFKSLRDELAQGNFSDLNYELDFVLKTIVDNDFCLEDSQYQLLAVCLVINRQLSTDRYRLTLNEADFYFKTYPSHFTEEHYLRFINLIESQIHLFALYCKGYKNVASKYEDDFSVRSCDLLQPKRHLVDSTFDSSPSNVKSESEFNEVTGALLGFGEQIDPNLVDDMLSSSSPTAVGVESPLKPHSPVAYLTKMHTPQKSTNPFDPDFLGIGEFAESPSSTILRLLEGLWVPVVCNTPEVGSSSPTVHSPVLRLVTTDLGSPKSITYLSPRHKSRSRMISGNQLSRVATSLFKGDNGDGLGVEPLTEDGAAKAALPVDSAGEHPVSDRVTERLHRAVDSIGSRRNVRDPRKCLEGQELLAVQSYTNDGEGHFSSSRKAAARARFESVFGHLRETDA